jgi:hypothetical protein
MPTEVKVQADISGKLLKTPSYLKGMEDKFKRWTTIDDPELPEALKDLSGDLWGEIRKFEAQVCREIEKRNYDEDFKELVKTKIRDMWRDIVEHQKVGIDKLGIVIRTHLEEASKKNDKKK